jgi:hypothetical protein
MKCPVEKELYHIILLQSLRITIHPRCEPHHYSKIYFFGSHSVPNIHNGIDHPDKIQ